MTVSPKVQLLLLGLLVVSLGATLGTMIWLKFGPRFAGSEQSLTTLNHYGTVPDFSLLERNGKRTALQDLRGKIWIVDFFYTTCTDTCPLQTATMAQLQEDFRDKPNLKLVSISVDPERDTLSVLSRYAESYRADLQRWLFLTGDKDQITRLVQHGFRLSPGVVANGDSETGVILHSPRFVLVDGNAQIRGYYDGRDPEAVQRLKRDAATLLRG